MKTGTHTQVPVPMTTTYAAHDYGAQVPVPMTRVNEQKAINIQKMKDVHVEETYGNYMQYYQDDSGNFHEIDLRNQIDRINGGKKYTFQHDGFPYFNNEGYLPKGDYMEWVVPTPGINNRAGQLRIITGEGHMWFMPNHHKPPLFLIK